MVLHLKGGSRFMGKHARMSGHDCYESKHKEQEDHCRGCICNVLRKLQPQTEVDVFLSSGVVLEDVLFINLNERNCCAFFTVPKDAPPAEEPGSTLIVDCQRIDAIRIEAD